MLRTPLEDCTVFFNLPEVMLLLVLFGKEGRYGLSDIQYANVSQ
jgi:hypothetical protein